MQEDTMGNSIMELMKQLMETDRKLTVLQTQISVLERLYRNEPGDVSKQALQDIFGFEPTKAKAKVTRSVTLSPEAAAKRAAGAAKARAAKAAKAKAEKEQTTADALRMMVEKRKNQLKATPKDYSVIKSFQNEGLTVSEISDKTHFTKESILAVLNDLPELDKKGKGGI